MAETLVGDYWHPIVIRAPRLGFLNLLGPYSDALLQQDRQAFASVFDSVEVSAACAPECDVLVVYCKIQPPADIVGRTGGLGGLVSEAGASLVIVAWENDADAYISAMAPLMARSGSLDANFVLTTDRRGQLFAPFLMRLFQRMFEGKTFPEAWVELVPQVPGAKHGDAPWTLAPCSLHVTFERASTSSDAAVERKHFRARLPKDCKFGETRDITWPAWSRPSDLWKNQAPETGQSRTAAVKSGGQEPAPQVSRYFSYSDGKPVGCGPGCVVSLVVFAVVASLFGLFTGIGLALALVLGAVLGVLVAVAVIVFSIRRHAPRCKACGTRLTIRERYIGVPVNVSVLWDPFNADVVKDLASEDFSVLEGAEPWGGLWKTQNRPTLFITLGKCVRCDGPFLMFVEMHGTDEVRNTAYLGDLILHREIEKESGERLLDIAQKRGLLMY